MLVKHSCIRMNRRSRELFLYNMILNYRTTMYLTWEVVSASSRAIWLLPKANIKFYYLLGTGSVCIVFLLQKKPELQWKWFMYKKWREPETCSSWEPAPKSNHCYSELLHTVCSLCLEMSSTADKKIDDGLKLCVILIYFAQVSKDNQGRVKPMTTFDNVLKIKNLKSLIMFIIISERLSCFGADHMIFVHSYLIILTKLWNRLKVAGHLQN